MKLFNWFGAGNYDYMALCNEEETEKMISHYQIDNEVLHKAKLEDEYFILINTTDKYFSFIPFLALAIGGMYNGDFPFSETNYYFGDELYEYDYREFPIDEI